MRPDWVPVYTITRGTVMNELTSIIEVSVGARIRYEFPGVNGLVTLVGTKSRAIHTDVESVALAQQLGNQGFYIVDEITGQSVPISRYARVEVL